MKKSGSHEAVRDRGPREMIIVPFPRTLRESEYRIRLIGFCDQKCRYKISNTNRVCHLLIMKKSELTFALLSLILDFVLIIAAGIAAYFIRFESAFTNVRPVIYVIPFEQYLRVVVTMAIAWIFIFILTGLYTFHGRKRFIDEIAKIFLGCSTGILGVILLIFFRKEELFSSRFIVIAVWVISILFLIFGRTLLRVFKKFMYKRGIAVHRVVVVGNDKTTNLIIEGIRKDRALGYKMIKHYKNVSGNVSQELFQMIENAELDDIFLADPNMNKEDILTIKGLCDEYHIAFRYAADLFDAQATNLEISTINEIPIIEVRKTRLDGWGRIVKRIFDIVGSAVAIIVFSPLLLASAIAIKLESKGPVIYKNERVSKYGNFHTYKFRSMYIEYCTGNKYSDGGAEKIQEALIKEKSKRVGPVYKVLEDPRRTKVGKILEKTSIDELPQFFNSFLGNMSLVGPRPHQPIEVQKYQKHHKHVLSIKPGITGLAQISGRSDLDFEDEVRLDTYYIENWSIWFDLYIILKTPLVLMKKRNNV